MPSFFCRSSQPGESSIIPMVDFAIVIGYNNSVIYDFVREKAYQVPKFVGELLTVGTSSKLPKRYIERLERLGIPINSKYWEEESIKIISKFPLNLPDIPNLCIIELLSWCNFQCPHCYLGAKQDHKELSFEFICNLLTQIREMGINKVHFTGGEICIRRDLKELIHFAYKQDLEIEIATNGSLISEDIISVIENEVSKVQITLYALNKKVYSKFSGDPSNFNKVFINIDKLKERCSQKLVVTFTLTPYNYQDLDAFRKWAEEKKLETTIGMTMPVGLAREDVKLSAESYSSFINAFIREVENERKQKGSSFFRARVCRLNQITILSNGCLTICPLTRWLSFGSVFCKNLEKLWQDEVRPFFNSLHVDNMEICKDCEYKYLCGGECPALWPMLEPIKKLKNPPCQAHFSTRCFIFSQIKW